MYIDRDNIICIMNNNMDNNIIIIKCLLVVSMCLGRPQEIFRYYTWMLIGGSLRQANAWLADYTLENSDVVEYLHMAYSILTLKAIAIRSDGSEI